MMELCVRAAFNIIGLAYKQERQNEIAKNPLITKQLKRFFTTTQVETFPKVLRTKHFLTDKISLYDPAVYRVSNKPGGPIKTRLVSWAIISYW